MRFNRILKGALVVATFFVMPAWPGTDELSNAAEVVRKLVEAEFQGDSAARLENVVYPTGTNLPDEALVSLSGSPAFIVRNYHVGAPVRTAKGLQVDVNFSLVGEAIGIGPGDRRIQRAESTKESVAYHVTCNRESNCRIQRPPIPRFGIEAMQKQLQHEIQALESIASTPRFSKSQMQMLLGLKRQVGELKVLKE